MFLVPERPVPPLLISWGGNESREFWRQSEDFGAAWAARGHAMVLHPQEGCDHFTASSGFADAESPFCRMVLDHMRQCW